METKRREFINVLRGTAIFLMLWGHAFQYFSLDNFDFFENIVFKGIYSFHMPLFMLISGYLFYFSFNKRTCSELIKHKTQGLLQPIIAGTVLYFLLTEGLTSLYFDKTVKTLIYSGLGLTGLSAYWFLWGVLSCSIVISLIFKLIKNPVLRVFLTFAGIAVVAFFPNYEKNIWMYPYFVAGFLFAMIPEGKAKNILINLRYVSLPVFPILLCFYKKEHYIYTSGIHIFDYLNDFNGVKTDVFRWIIGFAGSIFAITVLKLLFDILYKYNKNVKFKILSAFGKNSLQIYILQKIVVEYYLPLFYSKICELSGVNFLIKNMPLYSFVISPIIGILVGGCCLIILKLFEKIKLNKIIFGR